MKTLLLADRCDGSLDLHALVDQTLYLAANCHERLIPERPVLLNVVTGAIDRYRTKKEQTTSDRLSCRTILTRSWSFNNASLTSALAPII
jgi:hypothetical protein